MEKIIVYVYFRTNYNNNCVELKMFVEYSWYSGGRLWKKILFMEDNNKAKSRELVIRFWSSFSKNYVFVYLQEPLIK